MKRIFIKVIFGIILLAIVIFIIGVILAFLPTKYKSVGISPEEAGNLRKNYTDAHQQFITTDGETLFLRMWNPNGIDSAKKEFTILIFPGYTAYSGAYQMAGIPISEGGYTTFGLDYRGHGLSDGNRGDSPNKERWIADLAEMV